MTKQRGMIETERANYVLNPLPTRVLREDRSNETVGYDGDDSSDDLHVIVKREPVNEMDCPLRECIACAITAAVAAA